MTHQHAPARAIRFIHRALIAEAARLERFTGEEHATVEALSKAVDFLAEVVKAHTDSEEKSIFPGLVSRVEFVIPVYVFDHQEEEALFRSMKRTIELMKGLAGPELKEARRMLHRDAIAVYEHIKLHAGKEEELLLPLVEQFFSHAEQAEQIQKMMAAFAPELMARVMPWIVERLGVDDRVAYLTMLKGSLGPDAYAGAWANIKAGVSAGVAASIVALAP